MAVSVAQAADTAIARDNPVLIETLRLAVPLAAAYLLSRRDRQDLIQVWLTDAARAVGERGDLLQFRSKRQREGRHDERTAATFESLAKGLAAAAMVLPEGVQWAGLHWCARQDCRRCRPEPAPGRPSRAQLIARLEELDAQYRHTSQNLTRMQDTANAPSPLPPGTSDE